MTYLGRPPYLVVVEWKDDAFEARVPTFPSIHVYGESTFQAVQRANEAIAETIAKLKQDGADVPLPECFRSRQEVVA